MPEYLKVQQAGDMCDTLSPNLLVGPLLAICPDAGISKTIYAGHITNTHKLDVWSVLRLGKSSPPPSNFIYKQCKY